MSAITSIALSGLNAASLRVQAAASNLANARSNGAVRGENGPAPYTPLDVQQSSVATGGVTAQLAPSSREPLLAYDPSAPYANSGGYVASPDIDPADEVVALAMATYSFTANLAVVRTESEMMDALLDTKA